MQSAAHSVAYCNCVPIAETKSPNSGAAHRERGGPKGEEEGLRVRVRVRVRVRLREASKKYCKGLGSGAKN